MTVWRGNVLKWVVYGFLLLLLLVIQISVLPFIEIMGVHSFPLPVLALMAALFEGPKAGGIFGLITGMLCDTFIPSSEIFFSIFLLFACMLIGIAVEKLFRRNMLTALLWGSSVFFLMELLFFTFFYLITGKAGAEALLITALPELLLTVPWIPILYGLSWGIYRREKAQE